jgi:tetratricopeptide (TPR) repeat protein
MDLQRSAQRAYSRTIWVLLLPVAALPLWRMGERAAHAGDAGSITATLPSTPATPEIRRTLLEAAEAAGQIDHATWTCRALVYVAKAQWTSGFAADARKTIELARRRSLEKKKADVSADAFRRIALMQADLGMGDEAKKTISDGANAVGWPGASYREHAQVESAIAQTQASLELNDAAKRTLEHARVEAASHFEGGALAKVASAYLALGLQAEADKIIEDLLSNKAYEMERSDHLLEIVIAEITSGNAEHARATIRKAKRTFRGWHHPWVQAENLVRVATAESEHGWFEEAKKTLNEAHRIAARLKNGQEKIWTLLNLARVERRLDLSSAARASLLHAQQVAAKIGDTGDRIDGLLQVMSALAETGLYSEADKCADQMNDAKARRATESAIAQARIETALRRDTTEAITEASGLIDHVLSGRGKPEFQARLAAAQMRHGLASEARRNFSQALEAATKLDNPGVFRVVALSQASAGLYVEARKTAERLQPYHRVGVVLAIARAQIVAASPGSTITRALDAQDRPDDENALW